MVDELISLVNKLEREESFLSFEQVKEYEVTLPDRKLWNILLCHSLKHALVAVVINLPIISKSRE